jgi:hypothetical protein
MRGEVRKCPVCGAAIARGKLLCREHWYAVPLATRRVVNATWRSVKRAEPGKPSLDALRAYREAHDAAIAEAMRSLP